MEVHHGANTPSHSTSSHPTSSSTALINVHTYQVTESALGTRPSMTHLYSQAMRGTTSLLKTPLFSGEPVACPTATIPYEAVQVRESCKHASRQTK